MAYHYCTCVKDVSKIKLVEYGRSPYRMVLASREGICLDCGHYAIATNRELSPRGGQLYAYITGYKSIEDKAQYKQN
jgi:hypothetical protein